MSRLLHISSSPRGEHSASLQIADAFVEAYRSAHPDDDVEHWDLWDGTLPAFGPAGAGAKMTVFGGGDPVGAQAAAWRSARSVFERLAAADHLLFSIPMWNAAVPYILKQFIDVVSQPGWIFEVDPVTGYQPLLAGRGKRATVIYTSAVWAPQLGPEFGSDFQSTFFRDWLEWIGITQVDELRHHPTLIGDAGAALAASRAAAARAGGRALRERLELHAPLAAT